MSLARTPAERELVLDLLARITLFDLKAKTATVRKLPDGTFETTLTVDAAKFYADGTGKEKAAPLSTTRSTSACSTRSPSSARSRQRTSC